MSSAKLSDIWTTSPVKITQPPFLLSSFQKQHHIPVKNDEGGHHGDVQHENDDDDDDERAVRAADVGRVTVVAVAVFGREVCVARRLRVGRAFGEVTRTL